MGEDKYLVEVVYPDKERFRCELIGYVENKETNEYERRAAVDRDEAMELVLSLVGASSAFVFAKQPTSDDLLALCAYSAKYIRLP